MAKIRKGQRKFKLRGSDQSKKKKKSPLLHPKKGPEEVGFCSKSQGEGDEAGMTQGS